MLIPALRRSASRIAEQVAHFVYSRPTRHVLTDEQRVFWDEHGYLILPGHFSRTEVDRVNEYIDKLWQESRATRVEVVVDVFIGRPEERRCLLSEAPADARRAPHKLNNLYLASPFIREIVLEPRLALLIEDLLGAPPLVCNTLNLEYGSEQDFHTDSLYMAARVGLNLAASWIALEDCLAEAGPLRYYPGSHKIPPFRFSNGQITAVTDEMDHYDRYMEEQVQARGLTCESFLGRAGDVFLWHSQLLHGGERIMEIARTRRSLVTHYWRARDISRIHGRAGPGRYYLKYWRRT